MSALKMNSAAGLLIGTLFALGGTRVDATPVATVHYACTPAHDFVVESDRGVALVRFEDRTYELKRKASDIGIKYASPIATLIIDGPSAVFVAEDRFELGACTRTLPVAEAR